jgi:DNA replication and repair protein RecF
MRINKLILNNFRNYQSQQIDLLSELTFIHGNNAQGKTNILEAMFFLCTAQSVRANKAKELIRFGEEEAFIEGFFDTQQNTEQRVAIQIKKNGDKIIRVGNNYIKKISEFLGMFPVIFFSPEDIDTIKNSPQGRRQFIDLLFSQTNKKYSYNLLQYYKILKQRNECLKMIFEHKTNIDSLGIWDDALIDFGLKVSEARKEGISQLLETAQKKHLELTEQAEELKIKYKCSLGFDKDKARAELKKNRDYDIISGRTNIGPQRDDLLIDINGREARRFASHGQQRTAMISLKISEIEYTQNVRGERPIVLLDDVLLELDSVRFTALVKTLSGNTQTVMTGTETHRFKDIFLGNIQFYKVEQGKLCEKKGKNGNEV